MARSAEPAWPAGALPYTEVAPPPDLAAYVDRFWLRTTLVGDPARTHRVLPDGCVDLIVDATAATAAVVGTMTHAIEVPDVAAALVAVRFRPGTAAAIARCALRELTDRDAGVDELGIADRALAGRIADARSTAARLALLIAWVRRRLAGASPPDRLVARAVAGLTRPDPRGAPSEIDAVARGLGVTRQHLARAFRREVGVSPKQLARIARLQRAVAAIGQGAPLARLAVELGYFDQAHLGNEVRALAGATPAVLAIDPPVALFHLFGAPSVPFFQARRRARP